MPSESSGQSGESRVSFFLALLMESRLWEGNFSRNLVWEGSRDGKGSFLKCVCRGRVIISGEANPCHPIYSPSWNRRKPSPSGEEQHGVVSFCPEVFRDIWMKWVRLVSEFPSTFCFNIHLSYVLSSVRNEMGRVYFQCQRCLRLKFTRSEVTKTHRTCLPRQRMPACLPSVCFILSVKTYTLL